MYILELPLHLQEASNGRFIDIPEEVLGVYRLWRPTPLIGFVLCFLTSLSSGEAVARFHPTRAREQLLLRGSHAYSRVVARAMHRSRRESQQMTRGIAMLARHGAKRLEKLLHTPSRIYYKYEGVSPAGSHKPNTAVPHVWYNAQEGVKNLVTETETGQWGSALALACCLFGLNCVVCQVRASFDSKPYHKLMMQTWGAKVQPSPSNATEAGRTILQMDPGSPGSLGIAISEAVEVAAVNAVTKYCLGSVLNHVLLHQTVIGETPYMIIECTRGGSNFAGLTFHFVREKLKGKINPLIRAVEPEACPALTRGIYAYDYGDTAGMTPLMKMHTLGHDFIPDRIHAGGLRYHGMAPLISHIYELGFMRALAIPQTECFKGAIQFARETGESKVILMAMCVHGHFDLPAYEQYLQGSMVDLSFADEKMQASLANIPLLVQ
ncbi:tryptophan synthase beta type 2 [Actinidia rufa]|uniref:tryptophan synthase n=1 Tax=Actinidia rufa TaxID=165716 RepID=A0A7J0EE91_9ERIC|nr:tryptophan synthase beta type 2 [Actinidia rufa]